MKDKVVFSTEPEDFDYMDINVPCQQACPVHTNIPAYIERLFDDRYDLSYEINSLANIFPGVLGRICSRPCEDRCRHGEAELGSPVNICHIKRASGDFMESGSSPRRTPRGPVGKEVAVIGGGPSGLAAAHDLVTLGISVTVYEAFDKLGGMLRYGIPEFRLPRHVLDDEINRIVELGVHVKRGVRIGTDLTVDDLLDRYDAVLVAAGCLESIPLSIPGEALHGVYPGLAFMIDLCSHRPIQIGERVLVVGAGFTAFDCARSALRLGAKDVSICLRRTEEDLTVTADEIHETKTEGVKIRSLMLTRRIIGSEKVEGVEFVRTQPGEIRSDGKREISPIEGSEFMLPADSLIIAVGQRPEALPLPGMKRDKEILAARRNSFATSVNGLYVAGDYMTGPSTVIEAISKGRKAAEKIARDLTGKRFREPVVRLEDSQITHRRRSWDFLPRQSIPTISSIEDRFKTSDVEVETGYLQDQAKEESKRCYLCYLHYEIDVSRCIYCRYCIDVAPRDCIKMVDEIETNEKGAITGFVETTSWQDINAIVIDNSRCIRCGECMRICPVNCISVTRVELQERILTEKG
jgi:formate dehydrogenase major subunit